MGKWRQQIKNNRWEKKPKRKIALKLLKTRKKKLCGKKNPTEFELWWMKIVPEHKYNVYKNITVNVGNNVGGKAESTDRDSRWKKTGNKIIIYFRYEAKQYTISLPYKGSKHTPLLPRQRDFNRWIVVKYHSNITKVPFGRVLKTWDFGSVWFSSLWFLTLNKIYPAWMVRLLSCFKKLDKPFFCLY